MTVRFKVTARMLPSGMPFTLHGRDVWALLELQKGGEAGCSIISQPGPRWTAYVHALRNERGLAIETKTERHGGQFPGHHARYVLRSAVEILSRSDEAQTVRAA